MTDSTVHNGAVFYDAECRFCVLLATRCATLLQSRGFDLAPLQGAGVRERLHLDPAELTTEMRLLTPDGLTLGGSDALLHIARFIWWGTPIRFIARLPGGASLLRWCYRWVAARRHCASGACIARKAPKWPGWAPLLVMPALAAAVTARLPGWLFMWALAGAIFLGCKWLTWWESAATLPRVPLTRSLAYLFLWPGMDAKSFLDIRKPAHTPAAAEWLFATGKALFGAGLLWGVARCVPYDHPLLAGWIGMVGLIFLLHFGAFHLLALVWQTVGIPARPIMRMPIAARSLSEFWSFRWNRGFNDLAHRHLFQPALPYLGVTGATLLTFLASGLVHELVISVPARGGYGLPTLYFLLQGIGILVERSRPGQGAGLRRGIRGRLFALTVAAAPAYWLFHPTFVLRVIIPFMEVIKAI